MAVMHGPQVIFILITVRWIFVRSYKYLFPFSVFIATTFYSTFGRNEDSLSISEFRMYGVMWSVFFTFHLSHWEKYNTGIMVSVISSSVCITEKSIYTLHIFSYCFKYLPWGYDISMVSCLPIFKVLVLTSSPWNFRLVEPFCICLPVYLDTKLGRFLCLVEDLQAPCWNSASILVAFA